MNEYAIGLLQTAISDDQELINIDTDNISYEVDKIEIDNKIAQLKGRIGANRWQPRYGPRTNHKKQPSKEINIG